MRSKCEQLKTKKQAFPSSSSPFNFSFNDHLRSSKKGFRETQFDCSSIFSDHVSTKEQPWTLAKVTKQLKKRIVQSLVPNYPCSRREYFRKEEMSPELLWWMDISDSQQWVPQMSRSKTHPLPAAGDGVTTSDCRRRILEVATENYSKSCKNSQNWI